MSDAENASQTPLWGASEDDTFRSDSTERAVVEAIQELDAGDPLRGMRKAIAQVCRSLARNIDSGNIKGRAVANEATQLAALLDKLHGVETDESGDGSDIPEATRRLMDALATPPRLDTPSASYAP